MHEILIGAFITATTPVALMLLARAALYRDRTEGIEGIPARTVMRLPRGNGSPGMAGDDDGPTPSPPARDI